MKRIILDTNLWVSFLITGNYDKLDSLLFEHPFICAGTQKTTFCFLWVLMEKPII